MTFRLQIKTAGQRRVEALAASERQIAAAIDAHVEAQARALHYNSAAHLASYVASTQADWAAEALAFVAWRDQVWQTAIGIRASADPANPPDLDTVLAALPAWQG